MIKPKQILATKLSTTKSDAQSSNTTRTPNHQLRRENARTKDTCISHTMSHGKMRVTCYVFQNIFKLRCQTLTGSVEWVKAWNIWTQNNKTTCLASAENFYKDSHPWFYVFMLAKAIYWHYLDTFKNNVTAASEKSKKIYVFWNIFAWFSQ